MQGLHNLNMMEAAGSESSLDLDNLKLLEVSADVAFSVRPAAFVSRLPPVTGPHRLRVGLQNIVQKSKDDSLHLLNPDFPAPTVTRTRQSSQRRRGQNPSRSPVPLVVSTVTLFIILITQIGIIFFTSTDADNLISESSH